MQITKDNMNQAVSALRKCAEEHINDITATGNIRVSDLCNDVAEFLERIQKANEKTDSDFIETASAEYVISRNPYVIGGSAILSEEEMIQFNKNPHFIAGANWMKSAIFENEIEQE